MRYRLTRPLVSLLLAALSPMALCAAPSGNPTGKPDGKTNGKTNSQSVTTTGCFEAADGTFLLNGKPFVVKAAELHYPRIPRDYWEHRIQLCKALGMNTVCMPWA